MLANKATVEINVGYLVDCSEMDEQAILHKAARQTEFLFVDISLGNPKRSFDTRERAFGRKGHVDLSEFFNSLGVISYRKLPLAAKRDIRLALHLRSRVLVPATAVKICGEIYRFRLLSTRYRTGYEQNYHKQDDRSEGREKDVRVRNKARRAVVVDYNLSVCEHRLADRRSDHTGEKHLSADSDTLKHSRLAIGCKLADLRAEHRHSRKVAAHHKERADEDGCGRADEEEDHVSNREPRKRESRGKSKSTLIVDLAPKCSYNRGKNDRGSHYENVVGHTERFFVIDYQIGHKYLN